MLVLKSLLSVQSPMSCNESPVPGLTLPCDLEHSSAEMKLLKNQFVACPWHFSWLLSSPEVLSHQKMAFEESPTYSFLSSSISFPNSSPDLKGEKVHHYFFPGRRLRLPQHLDGLLRPVPRDGRCGRGRAGSQRRQEEEVKVGGQLKHAWCMLTKLHFIASFFPGGRDTRGSTDRHD